MSISETAESCINYPKKISGKRNFEILLRKFIYLRKVMRHRFISQIICDSSLK